MSLCIGFNASDINAQPKIFSSKYRDFFIKRYLDDFALDMYYFKVFNDLKQNVERKAVLSEDRTAGFRKGQGS